jgi:hypothetical protein
MKRMKNNYMTIALFAIFSFFAGLSSIQAQEKPFLQFGGKDTVKKEGPIIKKTSLWTKVITTPWIIQFGPDIVDDNDTRFKEFNFLDNRNYYPIHCSAEKYIMKGLSAQAVFSSETVDLHFLSVDLNAKYNLKQLIGDTKWFDPYVLIGGGLTYREFPHGQHTNTRGDKSGNFNIGGGANFWFFPNAGIYAQVLPKLVLLQKTFEGSNYVQFSMGVVFKIGRGAAAVTQVAEVKTVTVPSTYKRSKEAEDAANYLRDIINKK